MAFRRSCERHTMSSFLLFYHVTFSLLWWALTDWTNPESWIAATWSIFCFSRLSYVNMVWMLLFKTHIWLPGFEFCFFSAVRCGVPAFFAGQSRAVKVRGVLPAYWAVPQHWWSSIHTVLHGPHSRWPSAYQQWRELCPCCPISTTHASAACAEKRCLSLCLKGCITNTLLRVQDSNAVQVPLTEWNKMCSVKRAVEGKLEDMGRLLS